MDPTAPMCAFSANTEERYSYRCDQTLSRVWPNPVLMITSDGLKRRTVNFATQTTLGSHLAVVVVSHGKVGHVMAPSHVDWHDFLFGGSAPANAKLRDCFGTLGWEPSQWDTIGRLERRNVIAPLAGSRCPRRGLRAVNVEQTAERK
uniref:Uncharacterized protein n=1 Tax=Trichuris muris TaxID=70415 RepID=A0A5S6QKY8_TRIMR